jgi:hypothetical protein
MSKPVVAARLMSTPRAHDASVAGVAYWSATSGDMTVAVPRGTWRITERASEWSRGREAGGLYRNDAQE